MDLNGSTACYKHCSNGITMCVQVEILNGFKWSVSRRVNMAISIWRPPNITIESDPCEAGHVHWICFARANSGWSIASTGTWPGLRCWTAALTTSIECLIMATEWALSKNSGIKAFNAAGGTSAYCMQAWYMYAPHDIHSASSNLSFFKAVVTTVSPLQWP